jgi:dihydrofolate reductase
MSKIVVSEFVSLDGVMEAPERWHFPYMSEDMADENEAQILGLDAILLGRVTYEAFAAFWPSQPGGTSAIADKLNNAPKYVVSTTLQKPGWNNTTLIKEHVADEICKLKQQVAGAIGITGSAALVQSLMQDNLIDEYRLMVHPIVLGEGKRLFKDGVRAALELADCRSFRSGVVSLTFVPQGGRR